MKYPGINEQSFTIVLSHKFGQEELIDELIVLNKPEKDFEGNFRTRVEYFDVFTHKCFLYKYSEFLYFRL